MGGQSVTRNGFKWTKKRSDAALMLSQGFTEQETADTVKISRKSIWHWKQAPEFAAEVDRLTLMMDIAGRAQRLRIAMRAARQLVTDAGVKTDRDLLDWLKFAQSETDGANINIAAELENVLAMAGQGQAGSGADDREAKSE